MTSAHDGYGVWVGLFGYGEKLFGAAVEQGCGGYADYV